MGRSSFRGLYAVPLLSLMSLLVGCGGGGGGGEQEEAVVASFTVSCDQLACTFNASASDPGTHGSITSYAWNFGDGQTGSGVTVQHTYASTGNYTVTLTVTTSTGASDQDSQTIDVASCVTSGPTVTVSGTVTFDKPAHDSNGRLLPSSITIRPVRGATVEARCGNTLFDTARTDASGAYSVDVPQGSSFFLRVKAEMVSGAGDTGSWDFRVVDNTASQALWVMDSGSAIADSAQTFNVNAEYETRAAGPFAILDAVYIAFQKVLAADPDANFAALRLNWSPDNTSTCSGNEPFADGCVGTSFYTRFSDGVSNIVILGEFDTDSDEYDDHVVIHEWGHYFEDRFSRSDSLGGSHGGGDKLDMRVAFGEGWGNAWSGMATDDPVYADSNTGTSGGFTIDVENDEDPTSIGWFSETSVQAYLYDLYDATNGDITNDDIALGFDDIYAALVGGEVTTPALTSVFSFTEALLAANGSIATDVTQLLSDYDIHSSDEFAAGETNDGGDPVHLPVYKALTVGGVAVNVCSKNDNGQYNKLGNRAFLQLDLTGFGSATNRTFTVTKTTGSNNSDPDVVVWQRGSAIATGESSVADSETFTASLPNDLLVVEVYNFNNLGQGGTPDDTCFNVEVD